MELELADKVVLITGASGGLGRELALTFGKQKACVVVHYRRHEEAAEVVAQSVEAVGGEAMMVHADLADRASVEAMVTEIKQEWGGVDVLVNSASSAFERRRAAGDDDGAAMEQDARRDADRGVPHHQPVRALHARSQVGPHRQHRLAQRYGGHRSPGTLFRRQGRAHRADALAGES